MDKSKKDNKTILKTNVINSKSVKNWEKENKKAIDSYNQRVKENGLFWWLETVLDISHNDASFFSF